MSITAQINWHLPKGLIAFGSIDTCQILMLTKCVNCHLKILMFVSKVLQTHKKQLTSSHQCITKHSVLLIGNVSIVS